MNHKRGAAPPEHMSFRMLPALVMGALVPMPVAGPVAAVLPVVGLATGEAEGGAGLGFGAGAVAPPAEGVGADAGVPCESLSGSIAAVMMDMQTVWVSALEESIVTITVSPPPMGVEAMSAWTRRPPDWSIRRVRSEEHTSELQSQS